MRWVQECPRSGPEHPELAEGEYFLGSSGFVARICGRFSNPGSACKTAASDHFTNRISALELPHFNPKIELCKEKGYKKSMQILGIETSCDDTGIALLEIDGQEPPHFHVRSNIVASQIEVHQQYGGVFPTLAKREHQRNLPLVLEQTIHKAKPSIAGIAVTYGPGLSPCLWTGLNFAKDLAKDWNVPLIPVDHIEGHLLIGLLQQTAHTEEFSMPANRMFPMLGLIVSGGHTQLIVVEAIGKYRMLGETRDDAAGECFDKTARILGFAYPGGPEIAKQAAMYNKQSTHEIKLPRPMLHSNDYDFSFSGLKTAVLYDFQSRSPEIQKSKEYIQEMSYEIQQSIVEVLVAKTLRAAKEFGLSSVVLGGGVAANDVLRAELQKNIKLFAPPKELCTDNGLMISLAGYFRYAKGEYPEDFETLEANPNLKLT